MKIAGGAEEDGIVVGNTFDKYNSKNPIVNWVMRNFHESIDDAVDIANPESILEVGCGEGYWVMKWAQKGITASGMDFSTHAIELARTNAVGIGLPETLFSVKNVYDLSEDDRGRDLVVCCEVLEHLDSPQKGLDALQAITKDYVLLSVPREPLWCALNMLRGKYISEFGNTPGHIQHWSKKGFINLVETYFDIVRVYSPLPWTMLLCRAK